MLLGTWPEVPWQHGSVSCQQSEHRQLSIFNAIGGGSDVGNPKQQIIPPNHLIYLLNDFHMYTHEFFLAHYVPLRIKIKLRYIL